MAAGYRYVPLGFTKTILPGSLFTIYRLLFPAAVATNAAVNQLVNIIEGSAQVDYLTEADIRITHTDVIAETLVGGLDLSSLILDLQSLPAESTFEIFDNNGSKGTALKEEWASNPIDLEKLAAFLVAYVRRIELLRKTGA